MSVVALKLRTDETKFVKSSTTEMKIRTKCNYGTRTVVRIIIIIIIIIKLYYDNKFQ